VKTECRHRLSGPYLKQCVPIIRLGAIPPTHPELGAEILMRILGVVARRAKATEERFAEMCGVSMNPNRTNISC
jgi:hypothetical protein